MATAELVTALRPTSIKQPDISYAPNYEKYLARTQRRIESERLENSLPPGFPEKLNSDLVWEGKDIAEKYDWVYELSSEEINEIEQGLQHFKALNKPLGYISQETFPLPRLHSKLRDISQELHHGHGFKVLRGLPISKHTREDNIAIYAGVSSHVAPIRGRQDSKFEGKPADVVLNHIKDLSTTAEKDRIGAPAYTAEKQVFHTDSGDLISLLALSTSAEGGQSKLSSSWRVYNELAATRPDLIWTLSKPWPVEEFGNQAGKPYNLRPLLYYVPPSEKTDEKMIIQYARRTFTGYQALLRSPEIPPITEAQAEALDAIHFLAERFAITLDFREGDVQYVNNLSIFHARDGFKDTPTKQRHLVRLWLRDPEYAWQTPSALQERWNRVYAGVTPEKTVFPLEPRIRSSSDGLSNK